MKLDLYVNSIINLFFFKVDSKQKWKFSFEKLFSSKKLYIVVTISLNKINKKVFSIDAIYYKEKNYVMKTKDNFIVAGIF